LYDGTILNTGRWGILTGRLGDNALPKSKYGEGAVYSASYTADHVALGSNANRQCMVVLKQWQDASGDNYTSGAQGEFLTIPEAKSIDTKMDDGFPLSGKVRGISMVLQTDGSYTCGSSKYFVSGPETCTLCFIVK